MVALDRRPSGNRGRFLGVRRFAEEVKSKAGEGERVRIKIKADALFEAVCKVLGMARRGVIGAGKDQERVWARELVCRVDRSCTDLSVTAIAEMLGVDPICVSRSVARMEVPLKTDKRLEETLERIASAMEY